MKRYLRVFYLSNVQIALLVRLSRQLERIPLFGRAFSIIIDNTMLLLYGIEVISRSVDVKDLVVGHSTGVVLGGNGIRCTGMLHVSSGVVFGRRYATSAQADSEQTPFFDIDGDLQVGANSVLLGPLRIKGPTVIGALSLVAHDITEPGVYVGSPARRLPDR
jgi:serine acetyltransferase